MSEPRVPAWKKLHRCRHAASALLAFALFAVALFAVHKTLAGRGLEDIKDAVRATDPLRIAAAIGLSLAGYGVLTLYDRLALSWIGKPLPARIVVPTAFIAYALSHNLGFNLLTGTSVRYRMYTRNGLTPLDVGRLVVFASSTLWMGFALLVSLVLLVEPPGLVATVHLPEGLARPAGFVGVVAIAAYVVLCRVVRRELVVRGARFALPRQALAARQLAVASADWLVAATTLFILLPPGGGLSLWLLVLAAYLLASVAALISHVPGGVGVLEATVFLVLSPTIPHPEILAALVVFRAAYFFVPFGVALVGLVVVEATARRVGLARVMERLVAPPVVAGAVFLAGVTLLAVVATPSSSARTAVVEGALPALVLEAAHLLGGVLAALLLAASRGLVWRHGGAHRAATLAAALGGIIAVVVGLKLGLALVLLLVLLATVGTRSSFASPGGILGGHATPSFVAAVVVAWALCAFLFVLSHDVQQGFGLLLGGDEAGRNARALAVAGLATLALLAARRRSVEDGSPEDLPIVVDDEPAPIGDGDGHRIPFAQGVA